MKGVFFRLKLLVRLPFDIVKRNKIKASTRLSNNVKMNNCNIGNYCYIANNTVLNSVDVGNFCSIAPGVQIGGMEHSYWWYSTSTFLSEHCISGRRTIIGNDVWIAAGAIIKQGVTIGNCSVIGAMTFVNKDVPPNSIVVGIPGKIIKHRLPSEAFNELLESKVFDLPLTEAINKIKEIENKLKVN